MIHADDTDTTGGRTDNGTDGTERETVSGAGDAGIDHGEGRERRTRRDSAESRMSERAEAGGAVNRRTALRTLAVSGGAATAGCNLFSDPETATSTSGGTDSPPSTVTASPTDAPTDPPSATSTETPADDGAAYEKGEPALGTRWTGEVGPDNARPEHPRPQLVRGEWANLNGVWQFAGANEGESPPFDEDLKERILVPFPVESVLSGIERHETRMWYRRTFAVPDSWGVDAEPSDGSDRERLLLHFERVDWEATVYVNGEAVTTHQGGYDHFTADITDALSAEGP